MNRIRRQQAFYEHIGFRVYRKTDMDEQGKALSAPIYEIVYGFRDCREEEKKAVTAVFIVAAAVVSGSGGSRSF